MEPIRKMWADSGKEFFRPLREHPRLFLGVCALGTAALMAYEHFSSEHRLHMEGAPRSPSEVQRGSRQNPPIPNLESLNLKSSN